MTAETLTSPRTLRTLNGFDVLGAWPRPSDSGAFLVVVFRPGHFLPFVVATWWPGTLGDSWQWGVYLRTAQEVGEALEERGVTLAQGDLALIADALAGDLERRAWDAREAVREANLEAQAAQERATRARRAWRALATRAPDDVDSAIRNATVSGPHAAPRNPS